MILLIVVILLIAYIIYQSVNKQYERFKESGVPTDMPMFILGSLWRTMTKKTHILWDTQRMYRDIGNLKSRYIGLFNFITPIVMIKDPEIIKMITVKEFDHFPERKVVINEKMEPLFGKTLVVLKGQDWRNMRSILSPAFTSSKIREMCPLVVDIGKQMNEYLSECCQLNKIENGEQSTEVEIRDLASRYMNDVIATVAFAFNINSFKDKENDFYSMGKMVTTFSATQMFKFFLSIGMPKIANLLNLRFFPENMNTFFRALIIDSMKYREENNIVRRDMVQLLMEAKKGYLRHEGSSKEKDAGFATVEESEIDVRDHKKVLTNEDIVAQALLFFLAGFDTGSTLMCFVLHELAVNPDVQKKLQNEVDETIEQHGEEVPYDMIQGMKYLDMVISEGLRKWPAGPVTDRICRKDTNLGPIEEGSVSNYTIRKNEIVWVPIHAIQHDPKYWPEPEKFDPERFSDENKKSITPFTYLPFGSGPRNCIGSRFALMEVKIMLYHIMAKFVVEPCSRTSDPIQLDPNTFKLRAKNGFWLKCVERNSKDEAKSPNPFIV